MSWIAENTTHCYNWVCVYKGEECYQYKLVIWKFPSEDIWPICQDDQMLCILIIRLLLLQYTADDWTQEGIGDKIEG